MSWKGKKVLAIIPARAGSKRVVGKNIRKIGGRSLVAIAMELGLDCSDVIDKVVLSSDGDNILAEAEKYNEVIALKRPDALSGDKALAIDYVNHALKEVEKDGSYYEIVVILQPSSPFTSKENVLGTIEKLDFENGIEASVSVMEVDHAFNPFKLKELDGDYLKPYLFEEKGRTSSHEIPHLYVRNGSVYVTGRNLINKGIIISDKSNAYLMSREQSIDINDELDFAFAEFMYEKFNS